VLWTQLDTIGLIVDVEDALLNFSVDLLGCVDESFFNIGSRLRRCFHEDQTVLSSERLTFLLLDLTTSLEVTFVTNQHNDHIRV